MNLVNRSNSLGARLLVSLVAVASFVQDKAKGAALAVAGAFGMATAMAPTSAHAALTLDSAAILADIATVTAFVTLVGLAVLGLMFVIKAIRWARGGA